MIVLPFPFSYWCFLRLTTRFVSFCVSTDSVLDGLDESGGFCLATGATLWLPTLPRWHVVRTIESSDDSTWRVLSFRCTAFESSIVSSDVAIVICDLSTVIWKLILLLTLTTSWHSQVRSGFSCSSNLCVQIYDWHELVFLCIYRRRNFL